MKPLLKNGDLRALCLRDTDRRAGQRKERTKVTGLVAILRELGVFAWEEWRLSRNRTFINYLNDIYVGEWANLFWVALESKTGHAFFFGGRFQVTTGPSSLMGSTVPMWLDLLRSRFPTGKPQRRGWCWERWWWWTGGSVGLPCRIASVWDSSGEFCQKWDWS